jgi:hypothetical protein
MAKTCPIEAQQGKCNKERWTKTLNNQQNGSSVNSADFSALVEIKGAFPKEYQQKSSKYSEFFITDPKSQKMEVHKISLETELYCGLLKITKDL